jgi:hypothetical protein
MKNLFIYTLVYFLSLGFAFSQSANDKADDMNRIAIAAYVPSELGNLKQPSQTALKNRLDRIISKNGLGGASYNQRFILTAKVQKLSSVKVPSTPPVYNYEIEVTFIIGDAIEGTIFSSHSVTIMGAGNTESTAEIAAIKKIKESDPEYQKFIDEGKKKIVDYYNAKCDFYLKEAQALASKDQFEAAIATLFSIPSVCKECYDKAMNAVGPIYKQQIDKQCKKDLMEANNVWSTNQDYYGGEQASTFLAKIDPNSSCYSEAMILNEKISKRIKEIDKREWSFQLKQQQDDVDIRKAEIQAARDIGVAYGENQPETITTYNISSWWW